MIDSPRYDRQFSVEQSDGLRVYLDCFGGGDFTITVRDKKVGFEWSEGFGPLPVGRRGQPLELSHKHPFWRAASLWNLQGRRIEDGECIWHEPRRPVLKHLGGGNYEVIEDGEEGYDWSWWR
jgi:hypothetical protein